MNAPDPGANVVWSSLVALAAAGALGTVSRWSLAVAVQRWLGGGYPWGTLAVNVLGCFLFGMAWMLAENRSAVGQEVRIAVMVGFLGAFTTFSTYAFETHALLREGHLLTAAANLGAHNVLGIAALVLGAALVRWVA